MKRIIIVGMGYVGHGMQALFAPRFDVQTWDKKDALHDRSRLKSADLAVICVPTPQMPDGGADLSAVLDVATWIGERAKLVVIKSTVPPGTIDRLNESAWTLPGAPVFHFSPEYMGEGRNFVAPWRQPDPRDAASHDFVIVGGPQAGDVLRFFQAVMATDARYVATYARAAEMAKYMENAFLAVKVRFCVEFFGLAARAGVSYDHLRELWLLDPRVGRSHTLVDPEAPFFDGKCLPKDLAAIVRFAADAGAPAAMLRACLEANEGARRRQDDRA
jgi:UDPglucose 6-dehydrogenase